MKSRKFLSYVIFASIVLLAVVGLGDSYALNGMGGFYLEGLVPDYGVDCSLMSSFVLLSENNSSSWYVDLPAYLNNYHQISAQSIPQSSLDFGAIPQLIFHSGNLLIDINTSFDRETIKGNLWGWSNGAYQDLWIYLNPTFKIGNKVAVGVGGYFENHSRSGDQNRNSNNFYANLNGAVKVGSWILGAKVNSHVYNGISFEFLRNTTVSVIGNGNMGDGNNLRLYGTYSPGDYFNGNMGLSYFNQDSENISGVYLVGFFRRYGSKVTYYDIHAGPFLQRKMGRFIFRTGLTTKMGGNTDQNSTPFFNIWENFGIGYKVGPGTINLSSLWMWYDDANNNSSNIKISYESKF